MNKTYIFYLILILLFLLPTKNWAQSISGKIVDRDRKPLEFAAIAVLNSKDSILISYASADKLGNFELTEISKGKHIFQVHLIGYSTYQKIIDFKGQFIKMGEITLKDADNTLDEIVVNAVIPISIKKDTVAYNTKAFKVRVDDNVEDLLKKIPGIEVDASGKVTAHGEEVSKVYVDGKEFFSGDPAIATKNLSADAIKSIEVIDEKSEKSRVTGVNDSERKKVINLKLKDDKKVNDFGKIQGGYGTDDRYLTSLNYNRFSPKFQVSVIGKHNNVNSSGSDISEIMTFDTGGGRRSRSGNQSTGFLTTGVAGLNLGYELKKDQNLNADYFYNHTDFTSGDVFTTRTEFIGDLEILSEIRSRSENISNNHSLNFGYKDRSKKLSSFRLNGSVESNENFANSNNTLDKFNGEGELDLQSISSSESDRNGSSGEITLRYSKRFNDNSKRNISFYGNISPSTSSSTSTNNQLNEFNISDPENTYLEKQEIVRDQDLKNLDLEFNLSYTEPLAENHFLELKGDFEYESIDDDVNQSKLENDIVQPPLIYEQYYRNPIMDVGLFYKYDKNKFTFSIGGKIMERTQNFGVINEEEYKNSYTNFDSEIFLQHRPKKGRYMRVNLRKNVKLPSLNQLSPVVNDFNPLYIKQGNPYLIPEDRYSAFGMYIIHDFTSGFSFFSRLSYNYTSDAIVNSEFTNELGIRTTSYENAGDKNNFTATFSVGKRVKSLGLRYKVRIGGGYSDYLTIINNEINETASKNGTLGLSLENNKKEKIDASIGANFSKNYTIFSSGNNADRDYFQQTYYTKVDWNITDRFNLNSQFKYDFYTDSNFDTDQSVPIWNASVSYAVLKSKSLNIMISALDILNKNIGLVRNSSDNYFEETHKEVLGNYYMLSLTYTLNGNKNPNAKSSRGRHRH